MRLGRTGKTVMKRSSSAGRASSSGSRDTISLCSDIYGSAVEVRCCCAARALAPAGSCQVKKRRADLLGALLWYKQLQKQANFRKTVERCYKDLCCRAIFSCSLMPAVLMPQGFFDKAVIFRCYSIKYNCYHSF